MIEGYYRMQYLCAVVEPKLVTSSLLHALWRFANAHQLALDLRSPEQLPMVPAGCVVIVIGRSVPKALKAWVAAGHAVLRERPILDHPNLQGDLQPAALWAKTKLGLIVQRGGDDVVADAAVLGVHSLGIERFTSTPSAALQRIFATYAKLPPATRKQRHELAREADWPADVLAARDTPYGRANTDPPRRLVKSLAFDGTHDELELDNIAPAQWKRAAATFKKNLAVKLPGWFAQPFFTQDVARYIDTLVAANGSPDQDYVFRSDHLNRHLNLTLTPLAERLCGARLTTMSFGNFNWYGTGRGFGPHNDGSPFFDVSLVITLGERHEIGVVRAGGKAERIVTTTGDGLFFWGSELVHYGPNFDPNERHSVCVLAWTFVKR